MRHKTATLILVGVLSDRRPPHCLPRQESRQLGSERRQTPSAAATHAVRGVVKSIGRKSLVITRRARRPSDLTFVARLASTLRGGHRRRPARTVSVRYRTEDKMLVATAVTVDPANQVAQQ